MKKTLAFIIGFLCIAGAANAQTASKIELFAGYGFGGIYEHDFSAPGSGIAGTGTEYTASGTKLTGTLNAGILVGVANNFKIGITFSRAKAESDIVMGSSESLGKIESSLNTLMFTGKYEWLHANRFICYSRAGIGLTTDKGELIYRYEEYLQGGPLEKSRSFAWQVVPAGAEWQAAGPLALFAECGAGISGYGIAGLKLRF